MAESSKFFPVFLVIYYLELVILAFIVRDGLNYGYRDEMEYMDAVFTSIYIMILAIFEFYSVVKCCVIFQIEGLFQILPLKIYRYVSLMLIFIDPKVFILRLSYLFLDSILIAYFLFTKDSTFVNIFHSYNLKIGLDLNVRNSFIVSQF
ncbi:hypothetical protein NGRA_1591 [Nosema granulosis]|uniref:Uncharacterized protein n=1 Tax=Nosema granulosis TaxID=83296 RepID=A0A9P6GY87_9MICR|nr:hypothetical protein NGRA_1591 [Nosema granulosis]